MLNTDVILSLGIQVYIDLYYYMNKLYRINQYVQEELAVLLDYYEFETPNTPMDDSPAKHATASEYAFSFCFNNTLFLFLHTTSYKYLTYVKIGVDISATNPYKLAECEIPFICDDENYDFSNSNLKVELSKELEEVVISHSESSINVYLDLSTNSRNYVYSKDFDLGNLPEGRINAYLNYPEKFEEQEVMNTYIKDINNYIQTVPELYFNRFQIVESLNKYVLKEYLEKEFFDLKESFSNLYYKKEEIEQKISENMLINSDKISEINVTIKEILTKLNIENTDSTTLDEIKASLFIINNKI